MQNGEEVILEGRYMQYFKESDFLCFPSISGLNMTSPLPIEYMVSLFASQMGVECAL